MTSLADVMALLSLFWDAVLCGTIAGGVLGYLGVFILLRRMVFVSAALAQSAGFGVALAFFAGIHLGIDFHPHDAAIQDASLRALLVDVFPILGAALTSLCAAGVMSLPAAKLRLSPESLLALVWLVGAGGTVLMGDLILQEVQDISTILFGTAVAVWRTDLYLVAAFGGLGLAFAVLSRRGLVFAGFDPDGARVQGIPVRLLELCLLVTITLVVSVSTRALGALPVFAFSVLPGMAALLAAPRLSIALPLAGIGGASCGFLGYTAAILFDIPVGASQTAVAISLVLVATPIHFLWRKRGSA